MVSDEELANRKGRGLCVGCAAVFVALFIINYTDYIKKREENAYVEWDVKTVTAGDYAIEFDIGPDFFKDYIEQEMIAWVEKCAQENRSFLSRVEGFQAWLHYEMEDRVSQLPDMGYEDQPEERIKIAVTTLAFDNADIIDLLRQRGQAIKAEKWDKQAEIETKINELKGAEFDRLVTPCSVFMTFESEEGVNRALNMDKTIEAHQELQHI